ncbi:PREDICTED: EF-hand domain-containing family member C2-like [Ceratosolen solmsi marchali]|uniref:EF-hand domain-containing family member C2 n=1 Tax=Ceratosolen solmsi marchali TaxID=326594 RepID=A0AAJ6YRK5_9HYME|nr:PREDICTED: EF-hand domain-containing family member C2-like [Ceratosolen solmsi marchali]
MYPPQLPCLPGFNFNQNIGRTKFNKSHIFDKIHKNVYYLMDKPDPSGFSRYPALYAWGEELQRPPWLMYDGQRLKFNAYFQESVYGRREPVNVRLVNISFFLEDGTMKVCEPSITNSGLEQGILVKRQRIPLPDPVKYRYYDVLDLNIGMEPKIFGRIYKIINCDDFTRKFLNRMGISVPDPLTAPKTPTYKSNNSIKNIKKYIGKRENSEKFFKYDRKILRFYGYWDDSSSNYGHIHDLEILYYLADDTIEVFDHLPSECGHPSKTVLVKKIKIPKFYKSIEPIGNDDPLTILNVIGDAKSYYITDHSYEEKSSVDYYRECDFTIGVQLNIFGRKVRITDLDKYTKEYYRKKYGLDDFTPLDRPKNRGNEYKDINKYVPPYNGFGSYEDTLENCFTIRPKRPKVISDKSYQYENQETDRRILRFEAKMISAIPANKDRRFILSVYLIDNTVLIVENTSKKAGSKKSVFKKRMRFKLPGQNIFTSERPQYYEPQYFYVGATLNLMGFEFEIINADEYTFNYMEQHPKEFPKGDKDDIMFKIRETLKSVYQDFINKYSPTKIDDNPPILTYLRLREATNEYLGNRITEHEIITIARYYAFCEKKDVCPREYVRSIVHTELIRNLGIDLDRLKEDLNNLDRNKCGYLSRNEVYTVLYANRVPLPKELINIMLNRINKNEEGQINFHDLLKFINTNIDPAPLVLPTNIKALCSEEESKPKDCNEINWTLFIQELNLEEELTK